MISKSILDNTHESKLISIIREAINVNKRNPIDIMTDNKSIGGVWSASKFSGLKKSYTDIILDQRNRKPIQIALEDSESEFQIKTDAVGLNLIYPGILIKFINEVRRLKQDDADATSFCGKIPKVATEELMKGITVLGGPVDYYLFGDTKLEHSYDPEKMILTFYNMELLTPKEVAKDKVLYLTFRDNSVDKSIVENRVNIIKHDILISFEPAERIINIV